MVQIHLFFVSAQALILSILTTTVTGNFPVNFDWRSKRAVTRVKNQGSYCKHADWAFSAIGALETQLFIKTDALTEFSEQELIDCSSNSSNDGCEGGTILRAFQYIEEYGISNEQSYPYIAGPESHKCLKKTENENAKRFRIRRVYISPEWTVKMKHVVATQGPIMAQINLQPSFLHYKGGIYDEKNCDKRVEGGNHHVLIIGYGVTENSEKYWIIKNSWGTQWGEEGYMKIARDKNVCGIESNAVFIDKIHIVSDNKNSTENH